MSSSQSLASAPLPLLVAHSNRPNVITGLIPLGQLSPLVSLPAGQLVATSQGQILQQAGPNVVHVLQSPAPAQSQQAVPAKTTASTPGMAPLAMLLQHHQQLQQQGLSPPLSWAALRELMHFSVEHSCGRPFCKLKKREHYHCLDCNQAFSDPARLRSHIGKHGFKFKKSERSKKSSCASNQTELMAVDLTYQASHGKSNNKASLSEEDAEEELSSSLNLQPSVFTSMVSTAEPEQIQAYPTVSSGVDLSDSGPVLNLSQQPPSALNSMATEDFNSSVISSSSDCRQEEIPGSPSLVIDDSCDE
ncbi:zinc finger protein castor-like protein 1, partial [Elysia marginata]